MNRAKNYTYKKEQTLADTIIDLFADQTFRERLKKSYAEDPDDMNLLEYQNKQKIINEKRKAHLKSKNTIKKRSKKNSKSQIKNKNNYHKNFDVLDFQSEIETNSDILNLLKK